MADEIALAGAYLDIEKARLGERLHIDIHTGPGTLDARVPYLLLQPLIENAIRHGIAPRLKPGRVAIRFERAGGRLIVAVENDAESAPADAKAGVGLANVRARLETLHPGRHSIEAGADGAHWKVRIVLPCIESASVARRTA